MSYEDLLHAPTGDEVAHAVTETLEEAYPRSRFDVAAPVPEAASASVTWTDGPSHRAVQEELMAMTRRWWPATDVRIDLARRTSTRACASVLAPAYRRIPAGTTWEEWRKDNSMRLLKALGGEEELRHPTALDDVDEIAAQLLEERLDEGAGDAGWLLYAVPAEKLQESLETARALAR